MRGHVVLLNDFDSEEIFSSDVLTQFDPNICLLLIEMEELAYFVRLPLPIVFKSL